MKNTTKLKNILQLYSISLDMDEEGNFHLTARNKKDGSSRTFVNKAYTIVVDKAFWHMNKWLKQNYRIRPEESGIRQKKTGAV